MRSHNNRAIIAAAGSRKTQHIVDQVLADPHQHSLVTTYTTENLTELRSRLSIEHGVPPAHVDARGWLTFLLNECARPYQEAVFGEVGLIGSLHFDRDNRRVPKSDSERYYLDSNKDVYRDKLSDLVCTANTASGGLVVNRLAGIYDHIYIDEVQDLAGYDLELLDLLFASPIAVTLVGDPRQGTYSANDSNRNRRYRRGGITDWFKERTDRCFVEEHTTSYRCNQQICDFADALYPDLPRTLSKNNDLTGHDGIFYIRPAEVTAYVERYQPTVLRHSRRTDTQGLTAMNFGQSKGQTFDRVLIFPTAPMKTYLAKRDPAQAGDLAKFYVALTRARHSVAFVAVKPEPRLQGASWWSSEPCPP
ncbi:UvrD-helicase domain-containing protein [Actinomadura sp. NPDC048394]|jgi:ATP-dependent exoDNAse (exonuclease V) beta subunit|uniref:UvrD-helicase domain-containing protein n=1 Tax=Actinomadura sp. NPDC048394 TaxID=3158223 RepID=UPI0033CD98F1